MESFLAASSAYETGRFLGMATLAVLLVALIRRIANPAKAPRARKTDAIAALVVAALLIAGLARIAGGDDKSDPWKSGQGAEMKAGFIDGCNATSAAFVDCGCAFDHVTSAPPYDTPDGLAALAGPVRAAQQSGSPGDIPAVLLSAMQSCRLSAS
jgi:hypothetical protein